MATDHFCLKWNNFHNSIVTAFESLQSSEELVDVTLMCEGQNVKAHKVILSACSPYFRNLFKENPCQHPVIILKDVLHCDLVAILQFMYQGEVLITQDGLASFLKTAELLQVSGLAGNTATARTSNENNIESILPTQQLLVPLLSPQAPQVSSPASPAKLTPAPKNHSPLLESVPHDENEKDIEDESLTLPPVLSRFEPAPEPVQSCSYDPHDEMVIKTEKDEVDFPEMDYTSMSHDTTNDSGPPTEEQSILERSLKAHGISPHPTKLYTTDLVIGPQISSSLSQSTHLPPELINPHCVAPLVLIKTDPMKRKFDTISAIKKIPVKCILPKVVDAKKPKVELLNPVEPPQQPPKADVSHGSQFGKCPHCTKVYSNQSALKYHVRLVHSDMLNMFCCHLCPESFEYRESYKVHMWEIHSVRN